MKNALARELAGLAVVQQQAISVHYDGIVVGEYVADVLVGDSIPGEPMAVRALDEAPMAH